MNLSMNTISADYFCYECLILMLLMIANRVIVVTDISINKILLQFNFKGRKRCAVLYFPWYTIPEFRAINPDHFTYCGL